MCGIAGMAGDGNGAGAVRRMLAVLARRGPDGEGLESWPDATLGHRRLSIFDLTEAGRQPMLGGDRAIGVVFNGAIYNFHELRRQLEKSGRCFRTRTDTEVLVEGYHVWGIDGLVSKLRGMFAIGLWDNPRRTLFLVRDRLGVKPIVYRTRGAQIAFASTSRALAAGIGGQIDPEAVAEYLEFGYVTDDHSIYAGMKKLRAASILEWRAGVVSEREYWEPSPAQERGVRFDDAVAETEWRLLEAVKLRLQGDVPVGALLSGGVDSSLICWAIAKLGASVRAFTVGTPGEDSDETADARQTARELDIDHEVVDVSPDNVPSVDDLVAAYGEPFACSSALGMMCVSQAVKPAATVLVTGDGGDDAFLGYPEHRKFWIAERAAQRIPTAFARWWTSSCRQLPREGSLKRAKHFIDFATGGLGAVTMIHDGLPYYRRHQLLGPRLAEIDVAQRAIQRSCKSARRLVEDFLQHDRRTRFVGEYLTKVDGGTMYFGLEARSPFLDHELWNYAHSLPYGLRLGGGQKAVLRALARKRLGERVASGRKRGFTIPVKRWLAGKWRRPFLELLRDSELDRQGWIRAPAVMEQLRRAGEHGSAPNQLWYLYVLESWLRRETSATTTETMIAADPRSSR
jgi:asparagine synthase (glutamine-hydrolysing)